MIYRERLINLREENEIKQYELSDVLGIYKGTYNQYETEYAIMPIKHLIQIANYFNVSVDYLFGLTDTKRYYSLKKDVNKTVASQRLREFRNKHKLTQKELATVLNIDQSTIAHYESGRTIIATSFLYDICKKYKVSAEWLLGRINSVKYFDK